MALLPGSQLIDIERDMRIENVNVFQASRVLLGKICWYLWTPNLTEEEKRSLGEAYTRLSHAIQDHQKSGHSGGPCFEE